MRNSIYTIIAILLCSVYVQAQEPDYGELWNKANNHYSLGEYQQALSDYKKIEEGGMVSYKLYYNIANTYYKLKTAFQYSITSGRSSLILQTRIRGTTWR